MSCARAEPSSGTNAREVAILEAQAALLAEQLRTVRAALSGSEAGGAAASRGCGRGRTTGIVFNKVTKLLQRLRLTRTNHEKDNSKRLGCSEESCVSAQSLSIDGGCLRSERWARLRLGRWEQGTGGGGTIAHFNLTGTAINKVLCLHAQGFTAFKNWLYYTQAEAA